MVGLWLCVLAVALSGVRAVDLTLTSETSGSAVVEQVLRLIQEECVFEADRLLLRRLAHVESRDGTNTDTYAAGYNGGIWKVDKVKFLHTQSTVARRYLAVEIAAIKTSAKLNSTDWTEVTWEDLRKPLYSGLGAWLYLLYQSRRVTTPSEVNAHASYWIKYYRPGSNSSDFTNAVKSLKTGCAGIGSDMVFVLDASESISDFEFDQMKAFVIGFVSRIDMSPNKTRMGVIEYASTVTEVFALNTYSKHTEVIEAIHSIRRRNGETKAARALQYLREVALTAGNGARQSIAKVAVVMTDGKSNQEEDTIKQAALCKEANITMITIGIGAGVGHAELKAIASEPTCQHLFRLDDFSEFDELASIIEERSCEAPLDINLIANGSSTEIIIDNSLPPGGLQHCTVQVPLEGATVKLTSKVGRVTYYIATLTYPSEALYDVKAEAVPGETGLLDMPRPAGGSSLFCSIEGDPTVESVFHLEIKPAEKNGASKWDIITYLILLTHVTLCCWMMLF